MKLLFITHSPIIGGAELSLLDHIKYLDKNKYEVVLICSDLLFNKAKSIEGIKVIKQDFYLLYKFNPLVIRDYIKMVMNVLIVVKQEKIDIIITNTVKAHYIGSVVSILANIPFIPWMRDQTINKFLFDSVIKQSAKKIIYISHYIENYFGKSSKTVVIFNGTEIYKNIISMEDAKVLKDKYNITNEVVIVCIERLVKWKGVQILIDAINKLKTENIKCIIIGSGKDAAGSNESSLKEKVNELRLDNMVIFTGWQDNIYQFYQIADILIHPVIEPEPFGLVLIEGMSFKVPVISSNIGGPIDIIENNISGILIEPNNSEALYKEMLNLIQSPSKRAELGNKGYEKVLESFTIEKETTKLQKLYDSVLS